MARRKTETATGNKPALSVWDLNIGDSISNERETLYVDEDKLIHDCLGVNGGHSQVHTLRNITKTQTRTFRRIVEPKQIYFDPSVKTTKEAV